MKIRKISKSLWPVLVAAVLTSAVIGMYVFDANYISRRSLDEFVTDSNEFCYRIEEINTGSFFSNIKGYCFNTEKTYEFYNFGLDIYGEGAYIALDLCLVRGDDVYVLPSVQNVRSELMQMEEAEKLSKVAGYNFFAGVQSKYCRFLLPDGNYKVGIIFYEYEGEDYLLVSDRELVK